MASVRSHRRNALPTFSRVSSSTASDRRLTADLSRPSSMARLHRSGATLPPSHAATIGFTRPDGTDAGLARPGARGTARPMIGPTSETDRIRGLVVAGLRGQTFRGMFSRTSHGAMRPPVLEHSQHLSPPDSDPTGQSSERRTGDLWSARGREQVERRCGCRTGAEPSAPASGSVIAPAGRPVLRRVPVGAARDFDGVAEPLGDGGDVRLVAAHLSGGEVP